MAVYIKREPVAALEILSYEELDRIIQRNYEAILEMVVETRVLEEHGIFLEAEVVKAKKEGLIARFKDAIKAIVAKILKIGKSSSEATKKADRAKNAKLAAMLNKLDDRINRAGGIKNFSFNGPESGHLIDYKNKYYFDREAMPTDVTGVEKYVNRKGEWQKRIDADVAKFTKSMLGVEKVSDANPADCMVVVKVPNTANMAYDYLIKAWDSKNESIDMSIFFYEDADKCMASIVREHNRIIDSIAAGDYNESEQIVQMVVDYYKSVCENFKDITMFKTNALYDAWHIIVDDAARVVSKFEEK